MRTAAGSSARARSPATPIGVSSTAFATTTKKFQKTGCEKKARPFAPSSSDSKGRRKVYDLNDYVVIISPALEEDVWRGDVEVKIAWSADNDLEEEDHTMLLHVTHMVAAALELAEQNDSFARTLTSIVERRLSSEDEDDVVVKREDGNVVRVNFGKTLGSA